MRPQIGIQAAQQDDQHDVHCRWSAPAYRHGLCENATLMLPASLGPHQRAVGQMSTCQGCFDRRLRGAQQIALPSPSVIHSECSAVVSSNARGQLGGRINQARHDQRQRQLPPAIQAVRQNPIEPDTSEVARVPGNQAWTASLPQCRLTDRHAGQSQRQERRYTEANRNAVAPYVRGTRMWARNFK
jgi:hypothetical protein